MAKHILIGGGTGFIGRNLSNCLISSGYKITTISRMPGSQNITWHEVEKNGIPQTVSAVVNLAGQNVLDPTRRWTEGFKQNVVKSRINTTKALADAITASKNTKVFISICGISHYKPVPSHTYNENDNVSAYDFMSKLCIDWEKAADKIDKSQCRLVTIRSGVVIGRGGGMIQSMWWPFQLGLGGPMGSGNQILPWIHMKDLCGLIKYAIEHENVEGILNGVAPNIITNEQFSQAFAEVLNRPCIFAVPEFAVNLAFGEERAALLLKGPQVLPKRVIDYGFKYKYPKVEEALYEVVHGGK